MSGRARRAADAPGDGDDLVESLAIAYHELYRQHAGPDDEVARFEWADLPEDLRESNRSTARALRRALAALGYSVRRAAGAGTGTGVATLPPEHVQQLAEAEHTRWMSEKRARGYVYGRARRPDGAPPTHPDLVDWAHLSLDARDKDLVRFSAAPRLLAALGYEIVPRADTPP